MSDHEYTAGRKAVRGDVEARACIVCGNLPDECITPIASFPSVTGPTQHDQGGTGGGGTYETISGSPVSAPPPIKPRKPRRKKSA